MTGAQLQAAVLADLDALVSLPRFRWFASKDQLSRAAAMRLYWQQAADAELSKLLSFLPIFGAEAFGPQPVKKETPMLSFLFKVVAALEAAGVTPAAVWAWIQANWPKFLKAYADFRAGKGLDVAIGDLLGGAKASAAALAVACDEEECCKRLCQAAALAIVAAHDKDYAAAAEQLCAAACACGSLCEAGS